MQPMTRYVQMQRDNCEEKGGVVVRGEPREDGRILGGRGDREEGPIIQLPRGS